MQLIRTCFPVTTAALCIFVPSQLVMAQAPSDIFTESFITTVRIDGPSSGSGVIYSQQGTTYYVLTAAHVFNQSGIYEVVTHDGLRYPVSLSQVSRYQNIDAAVLTFTSEEAYGVAEIGDSNQLFPGNPVFVAGWAEPTPAIRDRTYIFSEGIINTLVQNPVDGYSLLYSNNTRQGMSGGPIFDSLGSLVGIHGEADVDEIEGQLGVLGIPINLIQNSAPNGTTVASATLERTRDNIQTLESFIVDALAKTQSRDFQGAVVILNRAIQQFPNSSRAYAERAWARRGAQDYEVSLYGYTSNTNRLRLIRDDIDRALQIDNGDVSALLLDLLSQNQDDLTEVEVTLDLALAGLDDSVRRNAAVQRVLTRMDQIRSSNTDVYLRYDAYSAYFQFAILGLDAFTNALKGSRFDSEFHEAFIRDSTTLVDLLEKLSKSGSEVPFPLSLLVEDDIRNLEDAKEKISSLVSGIRGCQNIRPHAMKVLENGDYSSILGSASEEEQFVWAFSLLSGNEEMTRLASTEVPEFDLSKLEEHRNLAPRSALNSCDLFL